MKNIHLLETNNPSRLGTHSDMKLHLHTSSLTKNTPHFLPHYIYITSNQEIRQAVEEWYIDDFLGKIRNSGGAQYSSKQDVIILTNDPDLIADGVQDIGDEFLEWFVKNPNCENVELFKDVDCNHWRFPFLPYKIIIPQEEQIEEPKQEIIYSEDEVLTLLKSCRDRFSGAELDDFVSDTEIEMWFNRNKK